MRLPSSQSHAVCLWLQPRGTCIAPPTWVPVASRRPTNRLKKRCWRHWSALDPLSLATKVHWLEETRFPSPWKRQEEAETGKNWCTLLILHNNHNHDDLLNTYLMTGILIRCFTSSSKQLKKGVVTSSFSQIQATRSHSWGNHCWNLGVHVWY